MWYAESKHVAECILNIASEKSGVPPLGYLPDYISDADWIPVDSVAATVLDIVHSVSATTSESSTYNIVNPHATQWKSIIETVLQRLGPQVKVMPLSRWIEMLEEIDRNNTLELATKPAVKILDFNRTIEEQRKSSTGLYSARLRRQPHVNL